MWRYKFICQLCKITSEKTKQKITLGTCTYYRRPLQERTIYTSNYEYLWKNNLLPNNTVTQSVTKMKKKWLVNGCHDLSCVMRKPVFRVSDQIIHKLSYAATEDDKRLEILDLRSRLNFIVYYM